MAQQQQPADTITDAERAADGRADSIAAVLLIAIAVGAVVFFLSGF